MELSGLVEPRVCIFNLGVGAHHAGLSRFCRVGWDRLSVLEFFLLVLGHPEACLDPLLLRHFAHDSGVFVFQVKDGLGIGRRRSFQASDLETLLGVTGLGDTHFDRVELLDLANDVVMLGSGFLDFFTT